jgi:hypothetical protein
MRLGDVLDEARRRTFVGRDAELTRFDDALRGRSSRRVFLLHGVGGIGKSTLLGEFREHAVAAAPPCCSTAGRSTPRRTVYERPWPARSTREPHLGELPGLALMVAKALTAAALADPEALRLNARVALLLEPAAQVFSDPDALTRVRTLGAAAPRYPLPGPSRAELLAAICA